MSSKVGIEQTKEMRDFLIDLANLLDKELADGFQWQQDLISTASLWRSGYAAFEGAKEIPAEFLDMDDQERAEYISGFSRLDIRDDKAEQLAEVIMEESANIFFSIKRVADAIKQAKG